ncbi:hypothetical protein, partial [Okeania sp. SIO2B9]|uniref:hypothetical protein n=1 Tax=Okeania sp. SIO2B9 TaxID=2607782 RepID=UPI00142C8BC5
PGQVDEKLPWLILLLFRDSDFEEESDKPKPHNITLGKLKAGEGNIFFPKIELEVGQKEEELVTVIDVKKKYLKDILPTHGDLAYLAHARKAFYSQKAKEEEDDKNLFATIISNRLPEPNGMSMVYLVSIEGRYTEEGFDYPPEAGDEDLIRFVSLANWNFNCIDPEQSFTQLLQRLNRNPYTLRLPENKNEQAENYLANSYITVPHSMRQGSKTYSWYRGPLSGGLNAETYELPAKAADELLRYDSEIGMFDISYAAAWQLGRMLMLQNQKLATELFNWKREDFQNQKKLEQTKIKLSRNSQRDKPSDTISQLPKNLQEWFEGLRFLQGVPFNYLVADEGLLPTESIRFFWIDPLWIDCLQDGAFSIGRVRKADVEEDKKIRARANTFKSEEKEKITGVILRSQVVSGWPGLIVDGYSIRPENDNDLEDLPEEQLLPLLRMEKLAKNVLICLFAGEVKTIDIRLQPESMHFGLDAPTHESPEWSKNLRTVDGEPTDDEIKPIPWNNEEKEVVNLEELAQKMKEHLKLENFTSGQFGLQMIEGVQKVRFISKA